METAKSAFAQASEHTANLNQSITTNSRHYAERASQHAENVDFFSENRIGAVVVCAWSLLIWLIFLPIFHLGIVPWMGTWESMHGLTVRDYMAYAEESYFSPEVCFQVLDANGDKNSTLKEFVAGTKTFKRPVFRYPAEVTPIFNEIDKNNDGMIQEKEFFAATPSGQAKKWRANMTDLKTRAKQAYGFLDAYYTQAMDIGSDGKVTEKEWVDAAALLVPPIPTDDAKMLFKKADTDGNQAIEPREWVSYSIINNFTFSAAIPDGVKLPGPRVTMAVQTALTSCIQATEKDLVTVSRAEPPQSSGRHLNATNATLLEVAFEILTGTRARRDGLQTQVDDLPNDCFTRAFNYAMISNGQTTPKPMATVAPAKDGPVTAKELEQYYNIPAVVEGHSELLFNNAIAGLTTSQLSTEQTKLMPVFEKTLENFAGAGVDFTMEAGQVTKDQDVSGAGADSNMTMIVSFTSDMKSAGLFQKKVQESGWSLMQELRTDIKNANIAALNGIEIHVWTRFTAAYYGASTSTLDRGAILNQHFGMFANIRNETGTPPFVKAVKAPTR
jgi:hypothetical protein